MRRFAVICCGLAALLAAGMLDGQDAWSGQDAHVEDVAFYQVDDTGSKTAVGNGVVPVAQQAPPGMIPSPCGGWYYDYGTYDTNPCNFSSIWDFTGGLSPTNWAGRGGYGPECTVNRFGAEWLLWFSRGRTAPPLVITGTSAANAHGRYPIDAIGEDVRNGVRQTYGHLLADGATLAEARFWGLEASSEVFAVNSNERPFIAQPVIDANTGLPFNNVVAFPGVSVGDVRIHSKGSMFGADAWARQTWWSDYRHRLDVLGGYQFSRIDDSIDINTTQTLLVAVPPLPLGFHREARDSFSAQNQFHGGTIGLLGEWRSGVWSLEMLGKLGLGNMHTQVQISGERRERVGAGPTTVTGQGLYAQGSNSGTYERNRFAAVPELNVNGVYNLSPAFRVMAGYSLIYWSPLGLAADQIDRQVNVSAPANPVLPAFNFRRNDFWVQGANVGAEYRW